MEPVAFESGHTVVCDHICCHMFWKYWMDHHHIDFIFNRSSFYHRQKASVQIKQHVALWYILTKVQTDFQAYLFPAVILYQLMVFFACSIYHTCFNLHSVTGVKKVLLCLGIMQDGVNEL